MSHSDLKAKDALSNFSAAVSNAQSMLQQDQQQLALAKGDVANKQDQLNTVERQCSDTQDKIGEMEARRAHLQQQRELREADQEEQADHLVNLQQPRKELEADAVSAEDTAQQIQSDYTDSSLDLQQKLLSKLRDEDCGQLERLLERKKAEKNVAAQRIARIEASIKKLQEPAMVVAPVSAPSSTNNSQSQTANNNNPNNNNNGNNQANNQHHGGGGIFQYTQLGNSAFNEGDNFQEKEGELRQLDQDLAAVKAKREALGLEKKATMAAFETSTAALKHEAQTTDASLEEKARRLTDLESHYYGIMECVSVTPCGRCGGPLLPPEEEGQMASQHAQALTH